MKYYQILGMAFVAFGQVGHASTINSPYSAQIFSSHTTFKDRRDANITKQDLDYSCGASSLSTILTYFYNQPTTEAQILEDMALDNMMSSFLDLAQVSEKYGFVGRGLLMDYETLSQIKIPAIVYLNHKRSDHFSVVRAIDSTHVYLADSSMGNRILTKKQFEKMWLAADNTSKDNNTKGKVLLILPTTDKQKQLSNVNFTTITQTQSLLKETTYLFRNFL